ncbi:hypothetical protein llap_12889 [Limosa lapponica baueri]|uniref:Uncharacterized protein n=1 Tax=Limosa lapponica baueri TaxID=1758121 RepID=A0A2I0TSM3_LIMLA|nr:hypothetical protein llap_12889 [Limosa lapponica baueri]
MYETTITIEAPPGEPDTKLINDDENFAEAAAVVWLVTIFVKQLCAFYQGVQAEVMELFAMLYDHSHISFSFTLGEQKDELK